MRKLKYNVRNVSLGSSKRLSISGNPKELSYNDRPQTSQQSTIYFCSGTIEIMAPQKSAKISEELQVAQTQKDLPVTHVAIIMDGNRRWADERGLPRLLGHKEGVKTLKQLVKHVGAPSQTNASPLKYLTVYAFSSENWNRSQEEVDYLFELFARAITEELEELAANQVRLRFIGDIEAMPASLQKSFRSAEQKTQTNPGLNLQVAINYGSRLEITHALKSLATDIQTGKLKPEQIDEALVSSRLYTADMPDPDLIIRTGGEMRLSNYLLWQAAYAELYVTPTLWPDFTPNAFDAALADFATRRRRYGGD